MYILCTISGKSTAIFSEEFPFPFLAPLVCTLSGMNSGLSSSSATRSETHIDGLYGSACLLLKMEATPTFDGVGAVSKKATAVPHRPLS